MHDDAIDKIVVRAFDLEVVAVPPATVARRRFGMDARDDRRNESALRFHEACLDGKATTILGQKLVLHRRMNERRNDRVQPVSCWLLELENGQTPDLGKATLNAETPPETLDDPFASLPVHRFDANGDAPPILSL